MTPFLLAALAGFPDRLAACWSAFPDGAYHWRPPSWDGIPSERLTALEQICHLRDIETDGYHVRFARTLREYRPVLADIDGERLAIERGYGRAAAGPTLAEFRLARERTVTLLAGLADAQWQREAFFEQAPTTLRGLAHLLCSHDNQHLAGLHWLLARMRAGS